MTRRSVCNVLCARLDSSADEEGKTCEARARTVGGKKKVLNVPELVAGVGSPRKCVADEDPEVQGFRTPELALVRDAIRITSHNSRYM